MWKNWANGYIFRIKLTVSRVACVAALQGTGEEIWKVISQIIKLKSKKSILPSKIVIDNVEYNTRQDQFNLYFGDIGPKLAANIPPSCIPFSNHPLPTSSANSFCGYSLVEAVAVLCHRVCESVSKSASNTTGRPIGQCLFLSNNSLNLRQFINSKPTRFIQKHQALLFITI